MNRTIRTLSRAAGTALALSGVALFAAGQASANDRAVVVSCTDQSSGGWTVSVTFSGIEVREDRPVDVSLGSDHATLTEPGANGTVTLQQSFGGDQASASLTWLIQRVDYQNTGRLDIDRPAECQVQESTPPSSEAPPTTTPVTEAAPTTAPVTVLAAQATPAPVSRALPATGRPTAPLAALGAGALLGGLGLVAATRRRPEQA